LTKPASGESRGDSAANNADQRHRHNQRAVAECRFEAVALFGGGVGWGGFGGFAAPANGGGAGPSS
jgi:hypothetical protein